MKKLIAFALLAALLLALFGCGATQEPIKPILTPETAPEKDAYAQDTGEPEGTGSSTVEYQTNVTLELEKKKFILELENPNSSAVDMIAQIVIQDQVRGQSGLLPIGHRLSSIDAFDLEGLTEGDHQGTLVLLYYNPKDGQRIKLQNEIPITVHVH